MIVSNEQINKLNDFLLSLFICIPAINVIITTIIPSLNGILMAALYLFVGVVEVLEYVFRNARGRLIVKLSFTNLVIVLLSVYYLISLFMQVTDLSIYEFIVYTIVPLLILSKNEYDYARVIRICPMLSFIGVFFLDSIFINNYNSISMGVSYAFLAPVVFSIVYLLSDRGNKIINICAVLHIVYLSQLFLYGSRGTILSIGVLLIILWVIRKQNAEASISLFRVIFVAIVVIIVSVFFFQIIIGLNTILESIGIDIQFIKKIIVLEAENNITNGREEYTRTAWEFIWKRPLFGHGISSFTYFTSMDYPHNFIIQSIFDLGFVGALLLLSSVALNTVRLLHISTEKMYYLVALICSSVPGALFSGNMWRNALLWLTFSFIFKFGDHSNKKGRIIKGESSSSFV